MQLLKFYTLLLTSNDFLLKIIYFFVLDKNLSVDFVLGNKYSTLDQQLSTSYKNNIAGDLRSSNISNINNNKNKQR